MVAQHQDLVLAKVRQQPLTFLSADGDAFEIMVADLADEGAGVEIRWQQTVFIARYGHRLGGVDVAPFMNAVVFGPVMGPHVAFLGGAIAVAYAAKKNYLPAGKNGRDVVTPLTTFGDHIDIYIVGGIGGMIGYLVNQVFAVIPPLLVSDAANHYDREILGSTDTIAMTIVVVSIVVRYIYGTTGMFSTKQGPLMWVGDNKQYGDKHWVGYQEKWSHTSILGVTTGILSGFATLMIVLHTYEPSGGAVVQHAANIGWAISAISLIFNAPSRHVAH